jgi:hypothetical protein
MVQADMFGSAPAADFELNMKEMLSLFIFSAEDPDELNRTTTNTMHLLSNSTASVPGLLKDVSGMMD